MTALAEATAPGGDAFSRPPLLPRPRETSTSTRRSVARGGRAGGDRGAELELVFLAIDGRGVAGVEVLLFADPEAREREPPEVDPASWEPEIARLRRALAGEDVLAEPGPILGRGRSGPKGGVRWRNLPPGRIVWRITSEHVAEAAGGDPSLLGQANRGGPIVLEARGRAREEIVVWRAGDIRGSLVGFDGASLDVAAVELLAIRCPSPPEGVGRRGSRPEAVAAIEAGGDFVLAGIRPGAKRLHARWRDDEGMVRHARRTFELAEGASLDLGSIGGLDGCSLEIVLALLDEEGASVPLRSLLPEDPPDVPLRLELRPEGGAPGEAIRDRVEVPLGGSVRLAGLPAGRIRLELAGGGGVRHLPRVHLHRPRPLEAWIPRDRLLRVPLRLETRFPARLRVWSPEGAAGRRAEVLLRRTGGDELRRIVLPPPRPGAHGESTVHLSLAAGRHACLVRAPSGRAGTGLVARGEVEVGPGLPGELDLVLEPAAAVEGVLRDGAGRARVGGELELGIEGWWPVKPGGALWELETEEGGRFRLEGLPPDTALRTRDGHRIVTGSPGSTRSVLLGF